MNKLSFFREKQYAHELAELFNAKQIAKLIDFGYAMLNDAKQIKELGMEQVFELTKEQVQNDIDSVEANIMQLIASLGIIEKFQVLVHNDKPCFLHMN